MPDGGSVDSDRRAGLLSATRAPTTPFCAGWIVALRKELEETVRYVSGNDQFEIFLDQKSIRTGKRWMDCLDQAHRQARVFMPILTPRYFRSDHCRTEARRFLRYQEAAKRTDLILPVYVRDAPQIENARIRASDDITRDLLKCQISDWRKVIAWDADSKERKQAVMELAEAIDDAISPKEGPRPNLHNIVAQPTVIIPDNQSPGLAESHFDHQLNQLQNRIETQDSDIRKLHSEIETLNSQIRTQHGEIESKRDEVNTLNAELATRRKQVDEAQRDNDALKSDLRLKQGRAKTLRAWLLGSVGLGLATCLLVAVVLGSGLVKRTPPMARISAQGLCLLPGDGVGAAGVVHDGLAGGRGGSL